MSSVSTHTELYVFRSIVSFSLDPHKVSLAVFQFKDSSHSSVQVFCPFAAVMHAYTTFTLSLFTVLKTSQKGTRLSFFQKEKLCFAHSKSQNPTYEHKTTQRKGVKKFTLKFKV